MAKIPRPYRKHRCEPQLPSCPATCESRSSFRRPRRAKNASWDGEPTIVALCQHWNHHQTTRAADRPTTNPPSPSSRPPTRTGFSAFPHIRRPPASPRSTRNWSARGPSQFPPPDHRYPNDPAAYHLSRTRRPTDRGPVSQSLDRQQQSATFPRGDAPSILPDKTGGPSSGPAPQPTFSWLTKRFAPRC